VEGSGWDWGNRYKLRGLDRPSCLDGPSAGWAQYAVRAAQVLVFLCVEGEQRDEIQRDEVEREIERARDRKTEGERKEYVTTEGIWGTQM
jgi:hypothetical protein